MLRISKVVFLSLIILCGVNYVYAQEMLSSVTIYGKVTDRATLKPIANAEVIFKATSISKKALTNKKGDYLIRLASPSRFIFGQITVSAQEYKKESRSVLIAGNRRTVKINFTLRDIFKPTLTIYSPKEGQEIFTNPTIELRYVDNGSGINTKSVKISANNKNITKYISIIDTQRTVCVVPHTDPLEEGAHTITAQISDYAGNASGASVSVKVVSRAGYYINLGKQALLEKDISAAHIYFMRAWLAEPRNPEANFYFALSRLAKIPYKKPVFDMLRLMGFTGKGGTPLTQADLDPFKPRITAPAGIKEFNLAASFPNGRKIQDVIRRNVIAEMDAALKNLNLVLAHKNFTSRIGIQNPVTGFESIEIDYADAAILKSIIYALKSKLHEMLVRNIDCDIAQLSYLFSTGALNPESILQNYPGLMRVKDIPQSLKARDCLVAAIDSYMQAYNSLKTEIDDQSDDLISISFGREYQDEAEEFAKDLIEIKQSLLGSPNSTFSAKFSQLINLGHYYTNPFNFRRLGDNDAVPYLLENNFLPALDYALNNLSKANINYQEFLPPQDTYFYKGKQKEVDFADISSAKAGLESMRMLILSLSAYNLDINAQDIGLAWLNGDKITLGDIVNTHPNLLQLVDTSKINSAREAFDNLVKNYTDAADYLLYREDTYQSDDLLIPRGYIWQNELKYRTMLQELNRMKNTLIDPNLKTEGDEFHINLGEFFVYPKDMRQFLPQFNENKIVPGSWPDTTFGGITPDNGNPE